MVMRNISKHLPLLPLLICLLLITGCKEKNSTGGAPQAKGTPEVSVVTIKEQPVTLTTVLPGRIAPHLEAEIRPQVSGIVLKRLFTEGGEVKEGEVLYQIDPAAYKATLANAKATLAKAEANSQNLKQHAERYKRLVPTKAVSSQDYEDAAAAYNQAVAEIAAAKAAVDMAQINLNYTRVTAPISGHIGRSAVTAGALVTANQTTALATIQQLNPVYVDVTQASADLLQLKQNLAAGTLKTGAANQTTVKLELENGSPYAQDGILKFSEVSVDQSTGSVTLRALFANPEQLLLPGMFVRALIQEGVREKAILVPQRGVSRDTAGNAIVLLAGAENKVERRIVKTERTVGDAWLLSDGLKTGDRVIVEGLQRIRPEMQVKVRLFAEGPSVQPAAAK
ncbi:MAG: efflux RND transporter periplasmic adaptor subunit [Desulfobulbus sp.]|nr:efflux RND transporter periplasmic adaptor subunit [Desulfobulbus sp.]